MLLRSRGILIVHLLERNQNSWWRLVEFFGDLWMVGLWDGKSMRRPLQREYIISETFRYLEITIEGACHCHGCVMLSVWSQKTDTENTDDQYH